ncbi:class I adenylate-forming enzyme family protein [Acrocarpospora catenulata]|uniref:class I adenylate-forming enzyme family protein n=1 Tax=Acrocarpospora catenulata TaxID=2836182 RepID=UPI001BDA5F60|nr:AMP-binding protein [Acrocarpospora catenulata]
MSDTMGEIFEKAGRRFGPRVAVESQGESRTFAEVVAAGRRLAHALRARGLAPGTHVAALLENRIEALEVYVGLAIGGYPVVHVNDRLTADEIDYVLTDSGAQGLVHTDGVAATVARTRSASGLTAWLAIGSAVPDGAESYAEALRGASDAPLPLTATAEDIAIIGYTSGTTGFPKGALASHRAVAGCTKLVPYAYRLPLHGHCAFPGGWSFVSGIWGVIFPHFYTGGTVSFIPGATPEQWGRHMAERGSTFTLGLTPLIPGLLEALRLYPQVLDTLLSVLHSGGPLPPELAGKLVDVIGDRLVETWGMTEVVGPITITNRSDWTGRTQASDIFASVGRPLPTATVRVVNSERKPVPAGEVGELVIECDTMFSGYQGKPDRTAEVLVNGEYYTGDLGYQDEAGYFYVTGRSKELIITGGANVYPAEVERVLLTMDEIADAAAFGLPDERWGETVSVAVVVKPGHSLTEDQILAYVQERLASYKKPRRIFFVDQLPRNSSMKVMKHVLRETFLHPEGSAQ